MKTISISTSTSDTTTIGNIEQGKTLSSLMANGITEKLQQKMVMIEGDEKNNAGSKQILSRKRRYLSFPSGSSFQVVYDQTLPIINLIDIFTIGVTVAIAWALPSEPLYKIHQEILDKYKEEETKRIDEIKQELMQDKVANIKHEPKNPNKYMNSTKNDNQINHLYLTPLNWNQNDWATVIKRIAAIKQGVPQPQARRMRYYPVFGKRSVNERYVNHEDMFYAHHHRASRQTLYEKIEKFLEAKGIDGVQCVLRALCETGQRANKHEPGTFLQEIMRAIFSLPAAIINDHNIPENHKSYDEAHSHKQSCEEKYSKCTHSIWDENFIF
uniref:CSON013180 protein n=1 Tax=Culicoides sonorensis TaxID=179676 RepID=A0A336M7N1_CULSO